MTGKGKKDAAGRGDYCRPHWGAVTALSANFLTPRPRRALHRRLSDLADPALLSSTRAASTPCSISPASCSRRAPVDRPRRTAQRLYVCLSAKLPLLGDECKTKAPIAVPCQIVEKHE